MSNVSASGRREGVHRHLSCDLAVVGGGMAGICAAITAAREGIRVVLVSDRPVLGGNASSEVRLWVLGATAHTYSNNRWAREGGVIDEILVENLYRNPEGNPVIFDTVLLEKVVSEPNITLLLNTAVYSVEMRDVDANGVSSVTAYCSQNQTTYTISAPYFCDASGDGVVAFQAGAAFRMGAEAREEFGELFAPDEAFGSLLGHSIYFYTKDTGKPVRYVAPSYALQDIPTAIPRYRDFRVGEDGCRLWWIEYGGRLDTVTETETIKWELWKIVYGVWDYIKNSGRFPEAETLTLEWVGLIPGKRESRRFEGDYILRQQDIVSQTRFDDTVAFGGWSIDLHPADGVFSEKPGCSQWQSRGVYEIPYRCLYSRNVDNLFLTGRLISASHVAFGSTRVMATCANCGQAVGVAAALCVRNGLLPRDMAHGAALAELQRRLQRSGQHLPGRARHDEEDLARQAVVTASSRLILDRLKPDGPLLPLERPRAQLIPLPAGPAPRFTLWLEAEKNCEVSIELRMAHRPDNHAPTELLGSKMVPVRCGANEVELCFDTVIDTPRYLFLCLPAAPGVSVRASSQRVTGLLALRVNHRQEGGAEFGFDDFTVWCPERRPKGHNFAFAVSPAIDLYASEQVINGIARPTNGPNAWLASPDDPSPELTLTWSEPKRIEKIVITFDTDYDHPMESVLMGHPEAAIPFCVKRYRVRDSHDRVIAEEADNHQTRNVLTFSPAIETKSLSIDVLETHGATPAAIFEVQCFGPG